MTTERMESRLCERKAIDTTYRRLCQATADELFGEDKAGQPVYAFAEPDAIARIIERAGVADDDRRAAYLDIVRRSLYLGRQGIAPFSWHTREAQRHSRNPIETPPSLPLLVVLTWAAESMHAESDMGSNNYYGRLFPLLDVPENCRNRLVAEYRKVAETIWRSLNNWLEAWEGERGVPTAYALGGMRYIGLPMSQAVVRKHDREGLHEVFVAEGLPPGFQMEVPDMEPVLDVYATKLPSPLSSNLRRLWANSDARERISQAACLELEAWTGDDSQRISTAGSAVSTRVLAYLRTFPRKQVEFNLAISTQTTDAPYACFEGGDGLVQIPTTAGPTGAIKLANVALLDAGALITNFLKGSLADGSGKIERLPRRVAPLRWDQLQGCFVEVERVAVGEDNIVLAKADAKFRVEKHLEAFARPGWELLTSIPGLPDGWLLFRQVQLVAAPDQASHVDLLPLVPRALTSLTLRGGFVLPGRLRKWSTLDPPEIVALAAGANSVTVRVFRGSMYVAEDKCLEVETDGGLAIVRLEEYGLDDGEYTVAMYASGGSSPTSTTILRLRSGNSPLFKVNDTDLELVYARAGNPMWPLTAGPPVCDDYINGAQVSRPCAEEASTSQIAEYSPRPNRVVATTLKQISLGTSPPGDSCMTTGLHRFQLPTADGSRPTSRTIDGECTTCGLVRRFAATPAAAGKKRKKRGPTITIRQTEIPPVVEHGETDQHIAFDALSHIGHGSYGVFERIAGQIEGSGLFADTLLRRQEVIGHLDVRRNNFLQPVEWAINTANLVPVSDSSWVLIGARSQHLVQRLRELLDDKGSLRGSTDAGMLRLTVDSDFTTLAQMRDELAQLGITLLDRSPALAIATKLPSLEQVEMSLTRVGVPSFRSLEIWHTASATWIRGTSIASTGAYRLRDLNSTYVVRSRTDLESGTVAIASAQLAKHIANRWARDPLIGYHSKSGSVVVPLGADLPGLYGRALSLCSGRAPRELPKPRLVQYPDVPRPVANIIADRLMN